MILQALYDYYDRCKDSLPPLQKAYISFKYAILIDENGCYKGLEPLGDDDGLMLLTFRPEERTSAPVPHCLGDNGSYVLGLKDINPDKAFDVFDELKKNKKNNEAFKEEIRALYNALPHNRYVQAVYLFYQNYSSHTIEQMRCDVYWKGLCESLNKNITFRIIGDKKLAATDEEVLNYKISSIVNDNEPMLCLITGKKAKPVSTTYSTFILGGKSNAKLVSFQVSSGYDSYGKKMGLNAPISEEAEFKYTTSLLSMLSKHSRNKFTIGDRTFVFWASNNGEAGLQAEKSIFELFGYSDQEDNPNRNIEQVRKVFTSIYSGEIKTTSEDKFYILGLAPNAARIAVIYWAEILLKEFAGTIRKHFEDMLIVDKRNENKTYIGLYHILKAVSLKGIISGKESKLQPNLPDAVVKSIFQGLPYPQTLFSSCIRRIRAENSNDKYEDAYRKGYITTRAAIIKAYLNRINNNQIIKKDMDKENIDQGYLCGRLFAVLEKIQESSNRENDYFTNLRSKYMNTASTSPSSVFPTLLNLSIHHSDKIEKKGEVVKFEKLKQEIVSKLDEFPRQLSLHEQGKFFIGYYHQRQDFFTKNDENNNEQ